MITVAVVGQGEVAESVRTRLSADPLVRVLDAESALEPVEVLVLAGEADGEPAVELGCRVVAVGSAPPLSGVACIGPDDLDRLRPLVFGAPHLSTQEELVMVGYASGLTLAAAARQAGVRPATAKKYLERVKRKYTDSGRTAYTKLDLALRAREDGLIAG
jgi:DNA-binding CsgD family transcriptional regulator